MMKLSNNVTLRSNSSLNPNNSTYLDETMHPSINSSILFLKRYFMTVPNITKNHEDTVTSAKYSILEFMNEPKVGQNFTVRIHARDELNRTKTHGGDFWLAFLEFPSMYSYHGASTSASVQDHQNGTYTVDFFIGWTSAVKVKITLVHPSRAVQILDLIWNLSYPPRVFWNGIFRSKNKQTSTICYMDYRGEPFWKDKCVYGNERALGTNTTLLCERPPEGFDCASLVAYNTSGPQIKQLALSIENGCECIWLFEK